MSIRPAVVFDLGKVLLDFDYGLAVRRLAEAGHSETEEVRRLLLETSLLYDFEAGRLDSPAFFERLHAALRLRLDYAAFRSGFAEIFTPLPEMIQIHGGLRAAGVPTFILSNTNEIAVSFIRRNYAFFREFDGYVLSYEVGCLKPDPPIYEALEKCAGRSRGEIFYLDDRRENIETALARGWRAVLHTSATQTRASLREAGFPV